LAHLYIHIPYCRRACSYCDFYFSVSPKSQDSFLKALLQELAIRKDYFSSPTPLQTVYFGGGTPSFFPSSGLARILDEVHKVYGIAHGAEITLEANPEDVCVENLKAWRRAGINRLSLGLQSLQDSELQFMNRGHTAAQAENCIFTAQAVGFANLSIDLIYATPGLSLEAWETTLEKTLLWSIPHISAYALTVEPKTRLAYMVAKGKALPADDEAFIRQFELLNRILGNAGYERYEISNFAKPGYRSRHNTAYWLQKPYLGLGPSAHSYNGKTRESNVANVWKYIELIEARRSAIAFSETLTGRQLANEFILTRLRLREGLPLQELRQTYGLDLLAAQGKVLERLFAQRLVILDSDSLRLTSKGQWQADWVTRMLFLD
jgi:oxygen-independent coproporphyrinogen-3 oxidase